MKSLFTTVTLWMLISMSIANAQYKFDTLFVVEQKQIIAQVIAPKIHEVRENENWKLLIEQFQKQMLTVEDQIPEYTQYDIEFVKGQKLTIEDAEVESTIKSYIIKSGTVSSVAQVGKARLLDDRTEIHLFFSDIEEVYSKNYTTLIMTAFNKMKLRPKLVQGLKDLYFPRDRVIYNNSTAEIEQKNFYSNKIRGFGYVDGTIGISKNDFMYSVHYGGGLAFGANRNQKITLDFSYIYQYVDELDTGITEVLLGGTFYPTSWIGFGIHRPLGQPTSPEFGLVRSRFSISLYPKKGGKLILNWNIGHDEDSFFGLEYGIPIRVGFNKN